MIIKIILLVLAIPVGYLIAYLTKDELNDGKKWFSLFVIISLALALFFWAFDLGYVALTFIFFAIISFVSFVKSKDKKWIKKRI